MKERASHEESVIRRASHLPVRAVDPLAKKRRAEAEEQKRREDQDTQTADDWMREQGHSW